MENILSLTDTPPGSESKLIPLFDVFGINTFHGLEKLWLVSQTEDTKTWLYSRICDRRQIFQARIFQDLRGVKDHGQLPYKT